MKAGRRLTIGFLTANIHIGASRALWRGVLDAARAENASVISYPGGRLNAAEDYEAERNLILDFIDAERLDGLVSWTSALAGTVTSADVAVFHERYASLPLVTLASSLGDSPMITINGYRGMRALVFHLIDVHNYRRLALIRGPEEHPYALERYHAFLDALDEKGLAADPDLITPPLGWHKGAQAMSVLLDERRLKPGVDFEAVVTVSDLLAIGALNRLAERGIRVPSDVAVVGFNDIEEGRLVRPSLTSVSLPFYQQGRRSVEVLVSMLHGEPPPNHVELDSTLLVRQSCGCPSSSVHLAGAVVDQSTEQKVKVTGRHIQIALVDQIARVISSRGVASTWAKQLFDSFNREIQGGPSGQFRATLDSMLQQGVLDGDETAAWQSTISVFRQELLLTLNTDQQHRAEALFGQARVVIGEAIQRAHVARQLQAEQQHQALRDIGQGLSTTFDPVALCDVLADRMPRLGIDSCYLALYENAAESTDWSRLVLAYSDGVRARLGTGGLLFPSHQLVPPHFLPQRRFSLVVEPLYFQIEPIGFAVFEVGPPDGDVYEVLRGHISTALKGALLFREAHDARLAAERADQIKTRLLANVSHELRTPLNIILGHTERLLEESLAPGLDRDLEHIQQSAEHQLRIINDLLDLSRAEINALDLYPVLLDPVALFEDAFAALADAASDSQDVEWSLDLPEVLPLIEADPVRLRQILLNLLSNAAKFTRQGRIELGAKLEPPCLHIWVSDTGAGIPPEIQERVYEPFFAYERADQKTSGIGLGLSITRHLVSLHGGTITLDSMPDQGSTFHIYLPLSVSGSESPFAATPDNAVLWLISQASQPPAELVTFAQGQGLRVCLLDPDADCDRLLAENVPSIVIWDSSGRAAGDWPLVRRLHNHPQLARVPFVLYQPGTDGEVVGLTSLVVKPASSEALWEAIRPAIPATTAGSVLIVDDDERARALAADAVRRGLPQHAVRLAENGRVGLAMLAADLPDLVILDLMMPEMDGFEVLDRMRAEARTQHIPVVILSGRRLSIEDVKHLEQHAAVTLHSKDILSRDEIIQTLHRMLSAEDSISPQTSALAKRTVAFMHQHYHHDLSRQEIAAGIGVNEDYLTRVFGRELGISPWDYLTRYRIAQARELLSGSLDSIGEIGRQVGFSDPAYFSRVFRRITGVSPSAYREHPKLLDS